MEEGYDQQGPETEDMIEREQKTATGQEKQTSKRWHADDRMLYQSLEQQDLCIHQRGQSYTEQMPSVTALSTDWACTSATLLHRAYT